MPASAPKLSCVIYGIPLTQPNNPTRLADRVSVHRPQLAVATEQARVTRH